MQPLSPNPVLYYSLLLKHANEERQNTVSTKLSREGMESKKTLENLVVLKYYLFIF
jgi:hypothetical protein